jgi:hypothetical protein
MVQFDQRQVTYDYADLYEIVLSLLQMNLEVQGSRRLHL